MSPFVLSIVLMLAAIGMLAADLFLPSGGIILVAAGLCSFASIVFAFRHSYNFGIGLLIFELTLVPVFTWLFVKLWPKTPLGRRMIIEPTPAEAFVWEEKALVGKTGIAVGEMLPNGEIEIDGRKWDATSRSGLIAAGTIVKIIDEEMGQLYVIPFQDRSTNKKSSKSMPSKESLLDRPAEELGLDKLE